jgi:aspartate carbamoyltransferase regulatory subunit
MPTSSSDRKHLSVSAIRSGTVIDHIRSSATFKVAEILDLDEERGQVLIAVNLPSSQHERKGIIKIENRELTPQEANKIALIAPDATINIIKDYTVAAKRKVEVQERVEGIVRCFNPNCITNDEPVTTIFEVVATSPPALRCIFCERTMSGDDIILL